MEVDWFFIIYESAYVKLPLSKGIAVMEFSINILHEFGKKVHNKNSK
ncbi:hypothetical protein [Gracilibacillus dipsosauri]